MRILHVTNWLAGCHTISGGAEAVCLNTINMVREAGHECAVFCLPLDYACPHDLRVFEAATVLDHLPGRVRRVVDFVRTHWRPVDAVTARSLSRALRSFRPDLVHFHKFERLGYNCVPAAARMGLPTVWSVYDYLAICPEGHLERREEGYCSEGQGVRCYNCHHPGRTLPPLQRALFRRRPRLVHANLRHLDRVVVLSRRCREIMVEHGVAADSVRVIHQPYEVAQTQPADPDQVAPDSVLFAGWLAPAKGLHVLLEAMPQVLRERPGVRLTALGMAGSAPDYEELLRATIARHDLTGSVEMLGKVSREEFLEHLRRCAVLVVPEQWENMSPVIVVEAMALARPVVAARVGGIPEFVSDGETGLLADKGSPEQFAEAILRVLSNPDAAAEMGRRGRERALQLFDREVVGRELRELYDECVGQGSRHAGR